MTTSIRESKIEKAANAYAKELGYRKRKIRFIGVNGAPDDLYTHRVVPPFFIEYKKTGDYPTTQQLKRHKELREDGFIVYWVDNLADAKAILRAEFDRAIREGRANARGPAWIPM